MKNPKIAIYAGSFDPPTLGHLDIIKRAANQFDKVIIMVANNPKKNYIFSHANRAKMVYQTIETLGEEVNQQLSVHYLPVTEMLVTTAQRVGATALIRGLRSVTDFEYELQMALTNRMLAPDIEVVFFMTAHEHLFTSSSTVRELMSLGTDVSRFLAQPVIDGLKAGLE